MDALRSMLGAGEFEPYIRYIRFPHYRNLRDNLQIEFNYPITALVGPNGTNKTAILRAIQGCPDYYNVGNYWFETNLDPISPNDRHRFIHGYYSASADDAVEVIKTRIRRRRRVRRNSKNPAQPQEVIDPDYFEPSRPIIQDNMQPLPKLREGGAELSDRTATRWKAIAKEVVYLDFRSQLSAFDKYFYQIPYNARIRTVLDKKLWIRRRSRHIATTFAIGRDHHRFYNRERIIKLPRELGPAQVDAISRILGRTYKSISVLEHRYFDFDGYTVRLDTPDSNLTYSEAFAGSGEFAVVMLVLAITEAPKASLILLDEPEVSLHPGGQRQLVSFMRDQAKMNRHQFIYSTHSPEMIRDLPDDAIKIFQADPLDGRIDILAQASQPTDAFFRLGVPDEISYSIFVEDALAAAIVRHAIRPLGESVYRKVKIQNVPGGASSIYGLIPAYATLAQQCLVFLDGDQQPESVPLSSATIPDSELDTVINDLLQGKPKLLRDGGNDVNLEEKRLRQIRTIIDWIPQHVAYLPGDGPESLLLRLSGDTAPYTSTTAKNEWERRTRHEMGRQSYELVSSADILQQQDRALPKLNDDLLELVAIRERIKTFLNSMTAPAV